MMTLVVVVVVKVGVVRVRCGVKLLSAVVVVVVSK